MTEALKLKRGLMVREKPVVPFQGMIVDVDIDKVEFEPLYLVAYPELDPKTGKPLMVQHQHGDSCDHDAQGNQLYEKDGVTPKSSGKLKNVKTEMVPVVHSRWMRASEFDVVPEKPAKS